MIKINKPRQAPAILRTQGKTKRADHCRSYTRHCAEYQSGALNFKFDAKIYGHTSVKQALIKAQHGKCCFCEVKVGADGDVEHFRPKSACCQGPRQPLIRPGYYWLAYEWDNLLLSCSACNQRHKRNYFPLTNPQVRACSHHDTIASEDPLFIDPVQLDPEQYIAFRNEIPYAINGNHYGKATITALRLDRPVLNEKRRERLSHLVTLRKVVALAASRPSDLELQRVAAESERLLTHALEDSAEFTAMVRAAHAANFYL